MKVMHILDSLNRGGAEVLALDVCRNARSSDLDLTFIATGGGDLENDFRGSGVDFVRMQRRLPVDPDVIRELRKTVKERNIQVVHSHQAVEALHAYLATLGMNVKNVLSFHGGRPDPKNRLALKLLIPRMDANIAVSEAHLIRLGAEQRFNTKTNFCIIPNGVDAKRLRPTSRKLRTELGLSESQFLLGMVGNFTVFKDQKTICKALPELFSRNTLSHFAFAGGRSASAPHLLDDCVDYCRQQNIDGRVHFLGQRADITDFLSSLDIFVFSSLLEASPVAVIEALMMGLPAVVCDIPPLLEASGGGAYALLFRAQTAEDLVEKLSALMNDPPGRAQLGTKAERWAKEQFSVEGHMENLLRLYESLLD
jgi:glycosyltransferase involved in cell wall biosynthesis